jgi:hypothetical protein
MAAPVFVHTRKRKLPPDEKRTADTVLTVLTREQAAGWTSNPPSLDAWAASQLEATAGQCPDCHSRALEETGEGGGAYTCKACSLQFGQVFDRLPVSVHVGESLKNSERVHACEDKTYTVMRFKSIALAPASPMAPASCVAVSEDGLERDDWAEEDLALSTEAMAAATTKEPEKRGKWVAQEETAFTYVGAAAAASFSSGRHQGALEEEKPEVTRTRALYRLYEQVDAWLTRLRYDDNEPVKTRARELMTRYLCESKIAESTVVRLGPGPVVACVQRACMEHGLAVRPADLEIHGTAEELRSAGRSKWSLNLEKCLALRPHSRLHIMTANLNRVIALTTLTQVGTITMKERAQMHTLASLYLFLIWMGDHLPRMTDRTGAPYVNASGLPRGWTWASDSWWETTGSAPEKEKKKKKKKQQRVTPVRELSWLTSVLDLATAETDTTTEQLHTHLKGKVVSVAARAVLDRIPPAAQDATSCLRFACASASAAWPLGRKHYWTIAATILWQVTQLRARTPRSAPKAAKQEEKERKLKALGLTTSLSTPSSTKKAPLYALTHDDVIQITQIHGRSLSEVNAEFRDMAHLMFLFPR